VFSKDGLLDALKKALAEGSLDAELGHHLAGERAQARAETARNHRNWHSRWQVGTDSLVCVRPSIIQRDEVCPRQLRSPTRQPSGA
jgi:transposase-like protein